MMKIFIICKHMNRFTLSPTCISASSCSSSTHSNLDAQSSPIYITNGINRTRTSGNLISKAHHDLQSNYYNNHHQSNGQRMSHKKRLMSVNTSPETDANKCRSCIISRTVLQLRTFNINCDTIRWANITMQSHEYIAILANNKFKIIDSIIITKTIFNNEICNPSSALLNLPNDGNIIVNHVQSLAARDYSKNKNCTKQPNDHMLEATAFIATKLNIPTASAPTLPNDIEENEYDILATGSMIYGRDYDCNTIRTNTRRV